MEKQIDVTTKFEISVDESHNRFNDLIKFINTQMKEGIDYGQIPGTKNKTLFKSGAEKLANIFGLYHELEELTKIEDWDKGLFFYRYRCVVKSKRLGEKVAEGIGSCNSKEKKYKNTETFELVNTIDKMAQKRAYVAAILTATRVSHTFTQDLEDVDILPKKVVSSPTYQCEKCNKNISQKVADFSLKKMGKMLCMGCQDNERK